MKIRQMKAELLHAERDRHEKANSRFFEILPRIININILLIKITQIVI
jgi:hypothetical protein